MVIIDRQTVDTRRAGFITEMHELRAKGYKTIGTGDGVIIYGLYAEQPKSEEA